MAANPTYRVFRPEIYSDYVKMEFEKRLVAKQVFEDFSDDVTGGGESIYIPHIDNLAAASSVTTTTGALTDRYVSDTRTVLTLNNWKAYSLRFTDFLAAQVGKQYNLQKGYGQKIAYGLAATFDSALLTEARDNIQLNINDSTTAITSTDCRNAMALAESYSIPKEDMVWIFNPSSYYALLRSTPIYDASVFGGGNAPMATGTHSALFGVPLVKSANTPTWGASAKTNFLVHRRTISYAIANINGMNSGPRLQMIKGDGLYSRLVGDLAYGVKILDAYAGVKIKSSE